MNTLVAVTLLAIPVITSPVHEYKIKDNSHWQQLANFTIEDSDIEVSKYKSEKTGLTIAVAKAETPVVNGYFCLPTQAKDNDGLPHILEHLIFLGSEDYPYKEALDYLANRCLAKRTNAWTSTDHTCYTVYTAGTSGFLQILPIYLDHLLFPTLRQQDFITEVHHITGAGHDAGVVYSEIQGSKYATSSSRALKEKVYPGDSGYYALTGGQLENMRNSTTMEKVRKYHKQFYRPENLILTITGRIEEDQLFQAIRHIEEKVINKRAVEKEEEYERPWSQDLAPTGFEDNYVFEHVFPDDDVDKAHVLIAWRLDNYISDNITDLEAYQLMFKYLTSSKVSPLEQAFVQSSDPIASGVRYFSYEYRKPTFGLQFTNVPTNRTDEVIPRMEKVIQQVLAGGPQDFDLVRMRDYVKTGLLKNKKENENGPHTFFPDGTLLDKIYGTSPEHFQQYVVANQWSRNHENHDQQFWLDLIDETFNKRNFVAVKGIPSLELSRNLTEIEAQRTANQIAALGPEGLKRKAEELEAAVASQTLPPDEILASIPLGDVNKILFRHLESYNRTHNPGGLFDFSSIPLKINIEDVKSKFVTLYIYLDLTRAGLTILQRKYLPLLVNMWTTSPLIKNGTITDIDGVLKRYNKVLLKYEMTQDHSYIVLGAQTELSKLREAVEFIHDKINYPYFTEEDLERTVGKRLNKGTPSASTIKSELLNGIYFNNETMEHYTTKLVQKNFLNKLKQQIEDGEGKAIVEDLYRMAKILGTSNNAFLNLAGDARELTGQYGADVSVLAGLFNSSSVRGNEWWLDERYQVRREHQYRATPSLLPQHVALGVDSTSSCYLTQTVLYNNTDWSHREVSQARVLLKYLSDRLYHSVRGKGLTYSISMSLSVSTGRIVLSISKSAQLTEAYKVVREIFSNYTQGHTTYDEALTDSSKGALIYSWAEKEETVSGLVSEAKKAYMRETDSHYNRAFTVSIADVTADQISQMGKRFLPLFLDNSQTKTVLVCNSGRVEKIVSDMKEKFGLKFKLYESFEDTFLNFE